MFFCKEIKIVHLILFVFFSFSSFLQANFLHDYLSSPEEIAKLTPWDLNELITDAPPEFDINEVDPNFGTLFHVLVKHKALDLMWIIVANRGDIDVKDANDETPLMLAIKLFGESNPEVVQFVINFQPNLDLASGGITPREYAENNGLPHVIEMLRTGPLVLSKEKVEDIVVTKEIWESEDMSWAGDGESQEESYPQEKRYSTAEEKLKKLVGDRAFGKSDSENDSSESDSFDSESSDEELIVDIAQDNNQNPA